MPVLMSIPVTLWLLLCSAFGTLLLLLLLLGLHRGEVDVPDEDAFENEDEEHDDEDGEQVWLVVEGSDGLRRRADLAKPIELTHCPLLLLNSGENMTGNDCACSACSASGRRVLGLEGELKRIQITQIIEPADDERGYSQKWVEGRDARRQKEKGERMHIIQTLRENGSRANSSHPTRGVDRNSTVSGLQQTELEASELISAAQLGGRLNLPSTHWGHHDQEHVEWLSLEGSWPGETTY